MSPHARLTGLVGQFNMGKLTSTIGIPIKLLNEAQVRFPLLISLFYDDVFSLLCPRRCRTKERGGLGFVRLTLDPRVFAGPRRHSGDHVRAGLQRETTRRCGHPSTYIPTYLSVFPRNRDGLRQLLRSYLLTICISRDNTAEDSMNVQLKDITVTARDGRVSHLDQVYIRGSHVRFFIVPDMLRCVPAKPSRIYIYILVSVADLHFG